MNMEDRLKNDLKDFKDKIEMPEGYDEAFTDFIKNSRKRRWNVFPKAAAFIIALLIISTLYYMPTIAYYIKKLTPYEGIVQNDVGMKKALQENMGQEINKEVVLGDRRIKVDRVITDDTRTTLLLTEFGGKSGDGMIRYTMKDQFGMEIEQHSGVGEIKEKENATYWVFDFKPLSPLSRKLTLTISYYDEKIKKSYEDKLDFYINRSKAEGRTYKYSLNKKISAYKRELVLNKLIITPTRIQIDYTFAYNEKRKKSLNGELGNGIRVFSGSEELEYSSGGESTGAFPGHTKGTKYFKLPKGDLDNILIKVEDIPVDVIVNKEIPIKAGSYVVKDEYGENIGIRIYEVSQKENQLFIEAAVVSTDSAELDDRQLQRAKENYYPERYMNIELADKSGKSYAFKDAELNKREMENGEAIITKIFKYDIKDINVENFNLHLVNAVVAKKVDGEKKIEIK